jgi:PAS domain S-box-containing protein
VTGRDVTDRRAADEVASRLGNIVEHSEEAIFSQDLGGVITSWNPAAERLYGYTAQEAEGTSVGLIIPAERMHEEADVVRRVRNGERVPLFDTLRRHKDGSSVNVALTVSPIRGRDGRILGASKIARDISERNRLEARDRLLIRLDDEVRLLTDAEEITFTAARTLGEYLGVNRCAYATVEPDEDTFHLTGNYNNGAESIVGRYTSGSSARSASA